VSFPDRPDDAATQGPLSFKLNDRNRRVCPFEKAESRRRWAFIGSGAATRYSDEQAGMHRYFAKTLSTLSLCSYMTSCLTFGD
jgi:hypothetical protein